MATPNATAMTNRRGGGSDGARPQRESQQRNHCQRGQAVDFGHGRVGPHGARQREQHSADNQRDHLRHAITRSRCAGCGYQQCADNHREQGCSGGEAHRRQCRHALRDVTDWDGARRVAEDDVKRKPRRVRHAQPVRGHDQLSAVDQGDGGRKRSTVDGERDDPYQQRRGWYKGASPTGFEALHQLDLSGKISARASARVGLPAAGSIRSHFGRSLSAGTLPLRDREPNIGEPL